MAIRHTVAVNLSRSSAGTLASTTFYSEEEAEVNFDSEVTASTTNHTLGIAAATAKIKQLYVCADQACTIYINDTGGGAPAETWTMVANVPVLWNSQMPTPAIGDVLSADVTNAYITTGATATNLKFYISRENP